MKRKLVKYIGIVSLFLLFLCSVCVNSHSVVSEEPALKEEKKEDQLDGVWTNEEGWILMLDPSNEYYAMKSPIGLEGRGQCQNDENGTNIIYRSVTYTVNIIKENTIELKSINSEMDILDGVLFEKDNSLSLNPYDSNELQGLWSGDNGVLISFDAIYRMCICTCVKETKEDVDTSDTNDGQTEERRSVIKDNFDGLGTFLEIDNYNVYLTLTNDDDIKLVIITEDSDSLTPFIENLLKENYKRKSYNLKDEVSDDEN